jgi:hypothetical protein
MGNAELAAQRRHLLAFQQAGYETEAFIHRLTLVPGHLGALPQMRKCVNHVLGIICKLSVDKLKVLTCMSFRASPAYYPGRFCPEIE